VSALAEQHGINRKTVAKWRKRATVEDAPMGPKQPRSTVLSPEEATFVAFRRHTLLPLDDCLGPVPVQHALQPSIPHLTHSSLHRCLQRHGISRLPEMQGEARPKKRFKKYPIGYVHVDIAEVRTKEGKGMTGHPDYLFVAIDRTSKVCYAELHERATQKVAGAFLRAVIAALPYRVHTVLTDNGVQFTNRPSDRYAFRTQFQRACREHGIEHRLTKPNHPWTNGQPVDERAGRADEPDAEGGDGEAVPLREPRGTARTLGELPPGVQSRQAAQDAVGADALRVRVCRVGEVTRTVRPKPNP
jgi:ribosomal protein L16/L10AE